MGKGRFFQEVHVVNAMPSGNQAAYEDLFNGDPATDVVNLSNYDKVTWIIQKAAGATGTAVVTVESCDDATPTTTTAIAFDYWSCTTATDTWSDKTTATSAGFTTTAQINDMYSIEVNSSELSSTDKYCRLQLTESANDPIDGTVVCILSGARNMHEVKQTAIS